MLIIKNGKIPIIKNKVIQMLVNNDPHSIFPLNLLNIEYRVL